MSAAYSLSPRRARIVRIAAVLFLLVGIVSLSPIVLSVVTSGGQVEVNCMNGGCVTRIDPLEAAPVDEQPALRASATARARFIEHLERPWVRVSLTAISILQHGPLATLMIMVGIALRRLGARAGSDLSRALPWLRRAALAALLMAITSPLAEGLRVILLSFGGPAGPYWTIPFDLAQLCVDLMLATAALAVSWALDVGSRATRDVGEFV